MPSSFKIIEHVIPGQHIREYAHATKLSQEATLRIAVKQYIPLDQTDTPDGNAITIVAAHGNGFPKVLSPLKTFRAVKILTRLSRRHMSRYGKIYATN